MTHNSRQMIDETSTELYGWRPISTVPINTQVMLLCNNNGNRFICIGVVYKNAGTGVATHWMPMPEMPKE